MLLNHGEEQLIFLFCSGLTQIPFLFLLWFFFISAFAIAKRLRHALAIVFVGRFQIIVFFRFLNRRIIFRGNCLQFGRLILPGGYLRFNDFVWLWVLKRIKKRSQNCLHIFWICLLRVGALLLVEKLNNALRISHLKALTSPYLLFLYWFYFN